ncbi:hypothetical protein LCGC14_2098720 [marine sediment metagenome]|uniref:Uncharacterized protein n=1 Tax=marine sediment metagenome TaxID=412755 RepID=A0A0F9EXS0_9ZZZZ
MFDPTKFQRELMDFLDKSSELHKNMAQEAESRSENATDAANKLTAMMMIAKAEGGEDEDANVFGEAAMKMAQAMLLEASIEKLEVALHVATATLQTTIFAIGAAAAIHIRDGGMDFDFFTPSAPKPGDPKPN